MRFGIHFIFHVYKRNLYFILIFVIFLCFLMGVVKPVPGLPPSAYYFPGVFVRYFYILPTFLLLLILVTNGFDRELILLRHSFANRWLINKYKAFLLIIVNFILILNGLFWVSLISKGVTVHINEDFWLSWGGLLFYQTGGFILIGMVYFLFQHLLKNALLSGFLCYCLFLAPRIIQGLFYEKLFSVIDAMFTFQNIKMTSAVFLYAIIFLFALANVYIIRKVDWIWRRQT